MTSEDSDELFERKLAELRRDFDAIPPEPEKSEDELRRMIYAGALNRLTGYWDKSGNENLLFLGKLLFAATVIVFFRLWSDLSTAIVAVWSLLILIDDYIGVRYLYLIEYQEGPVVNSVQRILPYLKRLTLAYRLAHVFVWSLIILITATTTTTWNTLLTAALSLPVLIVVSWWTSKKWKDKTAEVNEMLSGWVDDAPEEGTMAVES